MQVTGQYLALDDGRLYYEVAAEHEVGRATVVLSHAGFLDSRMFDPQWDVLAQHYRVIRYDMRGCGKSSTVHGPTNRRADLRRLLTHLGVGRAHFVGCSMGGEIVLDLALEEPDLVASLTLVDAMPGGFELQGEPPRYVMEMFGAAQGGDVERTSELQIRIWLDGPLREPDEVDPGLRAEALAMNRIPVEHNTFLTADMQPDSPLDPPAITRLDTLDIPVLIVVGALDDPEILRAADVLAQKLPDARKVVIENTAHVPSYERPDAFNQALLPFLANVRARI